MKFNITTSKRFYDVINEIEKLKSLGFEFKEVDNKIFRYELLPAFEIGTSIEIEITNLDALIAFQNEWGEIIIEDGGIEIYNAHRE